MGLGYQKSQRHAARDRVVKAKLQNHAEWMAHFEADGFSRDGASARAFEMVKAGVKYSPTAARERLIPDQTRHDQFMAKVRT